MHICSYFGNPWVGMFVKTNNKFTLVPMDAGEKLENALRENLKTEILPVSIGDSNLLGIYSVMNSSGIVLPHMASEKEVATIKKTGLNVYVSKEKMNAHGNNIVVNDKYGLINEHIGHDERKRIADALGVELEAAMIASYYTVGSACLTNNKGFLAHFGATETEMENIKGLLKLPGNKGSVNFGAGFISLGVIANDLGYVAGEKTSGFEIGRVEEALGYI